MSFKQYFHGRERDGGNRFVVIMRNLNQFIPYQNLKMKSLFCLHKSLQDGNYICKLNMKDAYFPVPLRHSPRTCVRFSWSGNLYDFLCLCFGLRLSSAPKVFTKLLKIPISIPRRINIWIVIYLDNMLMMGQTLEEILMARDTVMLLLQNLVFVLNLDKSILSLAQKIELLWVKIKFLNMYRGT